MQLEDPRRGQSQPRVRACRPVLSHSYRDPKGARSDSREGRLCPRHSDHLSPSLPQEPGHLVLSSQPQIPTCRQAEAGKGCILHTVYQFNVKWFASNNFLIKNFLKNRGYPRS